MAMKRAVKTPIVDAATGAPKAIVHRKKSPERQAIVLKGLRLGLTFEQAASYAGITKVTIRNWREDDPEFDAQCASARAQLEAAMLARVAIAAQDPKTWGAAAWNLERMFPDRYGRTTRTELTGRGGGPIEVMDVRKLSDDELRKIASGEVTTYDAEGDV